METGIGARVRQIRESRHMSIRATAELAGRSHAWLSLIERGRRSLDRRSDIDALAAALQVSPTDLLQQPYVPVDRADSDAQAQMEAVRVALVSTDLRYPTEIERPAPLAHTVLAAQAARTGLYRRGDVTAAVTALPDLLRTLHSYALQGPEDQRAQALGALVEACCTGVSAAKVLGYPDLAWISAERGRQAAHLLDDATMIGLADFYMSYALRPYRVAATNTSRALAAAEPAAGTGPQMMQIYGMLHMMAAFGAAVTGRDSAMDAHLREASDLAARTGDTAEMELYFGPTNIAIWRVTMAVERGEGALAREIADGLNTETVSRRRRADFMIDLARAFGQERRDQDALRCLRQAEALMPQKVHNDPFSRQMIGDMYRRARRRTGSPDLRALATRVGVDVV